MVRSMKINSVDHRSKMQRLSLLLAGLLIVLWLPSAQADARIRVILTNRSGYNVKFYFTSGNYAPESYYLAGGQRGVYYMSRSGGRTSISIGQTYGFVTQMISAGSYDIYYNPEQQQIRIRYAR
jgi:hypothetical protein